MSADPSSIDRGLLIDELPDAVLVTDHQARLRWGNHAAEVLFGRSLEDSVGLDCITLIHPDDLEMAAISLAGILSPIDPIPVANGNVALDLDRDPPLATFDSAKTREQKAAPGPRYLSHFATCPDAQRFRKLREVKA